MNKQACHLVLTIYDGSETEPDSAFDTRIEIVGDVVGRFSCTACQGIEKSNQEISRGFGKNVCELCKGKGFLLVGL